MQLHPSPISHDQRQDYASASTPPTILTLASATVRIGEALLTAERLPPGERAELLRTIAAEQRALASKVDALANHLDPLGDAVVVVRCRHCGDEQPTPIDWSAPCGACGGER